MSGELQLSGVGAESVVAARVEGGDVVLLACPLDTDLVYLIGRPDIKTAEQLKGEIDRGYAFGFEHSFLSAFGAKVSRYGRR